MNSTCLLCLGLFLTAVSTFLALAALKLETFNRAKLRKLRESGRDLAAAMEQLLPLPRLRLCNHIELALFTIAAVALLTCWYRATGLPVYGRWILLSSVTLAVFLTVQLLDQSLSLRASAKLLRWAGRTARLFLWPFAFLVLPLDALDRYQQKHNANAEDPAQVTAEDEILSFVEDDAPRSAQPAGGASPLNDLESDEKRMLNGVINLDKTLVHEIMTPRVDIDAISETSSIDQARAAISKSGHSRIPVFGKSIDAITGILYAKDLLDEQRLKAAKALTELAHPPVFIPETKNVSDLLEEFRLKRIHLAVVIDEYGGTAGIVTIEDILEEIVGEIQDEFDRDAATPPETATQPDGSIITDGRMTIWEVNQALDLEISEEEGYDTLGGYIMATLGRIPRTGEHVETPELSIDILNASPRRLNTLKIKKKV